MAKWEKVKTASRYVRTFHYNSCKGNFVYLEEQARALPWKIKFYRELYLYNKVLSNFSWTIYKWLLFSLTRLQLTRRVVLINKKGIFSIKKKSKIIIILLPLNWHPNSSTFVLWLYHFRQLEGTTLVFLFGINHPTHVSPSVAVSFKYAEES